ncbi:hypothetical protein NDU88_004172 [Pleurodeles waltl]|uniref:Uncharacterized protein n=1 Tax=Pleurodeles waltl TaxID=8319 RepID=A0AAV7NMS3_PLEWA|nr:hypothetical protein NDU88_004172 [Pleurodeles waltl]
METASQEDAEDKFEGGDRIQDPRGLPVPSAPLEYVKRGPASEALAATLEGSNAERQEEVDENRQRRPQHGSSVSLHCGEEDSNGKAQVVGVSEHCTPDLFSFFQVSDAQQDPESGEHNAAHPPRGEEKAWCRTVGWTAWQDPALIDSQRSSETSSGDRRTRREHRRLNGYMGHVSLHQEFLGGFGPAPQGEVYGEPLVRRMVPHGMAGVKPGQDDE